MDLMNEAMFAAGIFCLGVGVMFAAMSILERRDRKRRERRMREIRQGGARR